MTEELVAFMESLIDEALSHADADDYYTRTGTIHTDHLPPPPTRTRTRPSDGRPVGDPHFDYDEYVTRKKDRIAADPETHQREKVAKREASRQWWDNYTLRGQIDRANENIAGLGISNRLRDIWLAIAQSEQSKRLEDIHLDQASRIANRKNLERCQGRPRGLNRAARKAGY